LLFDHALESVAIDAVSKRVNFVISWMKSRGYTDRPEQAANFSERRCVKLANEKTVKSKLKFPFIIFQNKDP